LRAGLDNRNLTPGLWRSPLGIEKALAELAHAVTDRNADHFGEHLRRHLRRPCPAPAFAKPCPSTPFAIDATLDGDRGYDDRFGRHVGPPSRSLAEHRAST
jgi:hypothetical protein